MIIQRFNACKNNISLMDEIGPRFLENIVTEDVYKKRVKGVGITKSEASKCSLHATTHKKIVMITVFWDVKGLLKVDFTDGVINFDYYIDLINEVRSLQRKQSNHDLYLLHNNAPVHKPNRTQEEIARLCFVQMEHPPYSPDLAPSDFWLFNNLKKHLRGRKFNSKDDLKIEVNNFFSERDNTFLKIGFETMVNRWRKCVVVNENYVEKWYLYTLLVSNTKFGWLTFFISIRV